ncbi:unnamed protein product [Rhizophagus irregularis]|nr:unnamed protein product [Rhizophagus irregularis]
MIGCPWHINLAFPKFSNGVRINSIIGKHNHEMNPHISEIAPRFRKLTDKMLEKVKFWTIQEKMGISTQYNLLVALFPDKVINKKDLSNAIQQFKKQVKPSKNDACQMLTELYLKKDDDPRWIIKLRFDVGERRLNSLFWMSPDQVNAYGKYHDIVIIDTTSRTNQFDMILMSSCLTDVVGEIQRIFDQQSKRAILSECKNEIPTRGIPSIMDEYFPNLDKILREYLTPQILQKQRDQMVQSLCYDTVLIKDWQPLLEMMDDSYQQEIAREDDYDQPQSLFSLLVENIPYNNILQVWKVTRHCGQNSEPQYIILLNDADESEQPSFQHLMNFRQTPNVVQLQDPKQKYGFGMGYAKKALDLAVQTDKVDEFVDQVKYFIENTKAELSEQQENLTSMHIGDPL